MSDNSFPGSAAQSTPDLATASPRDHLATAIDAAMDSWPNRPWLVLVDLAPELARHIRDEVLADADLLDALCVYRASQINADRREPRTWKSVRGIPFNVLFRGSPAGSLTWRRLDGDACVPVDGYGVWTNDEMDASNPDGFVEVIP